MLTPQSVTDIDYLPEDILIHYGQYYNLTELAALVLVSKYWYRWVHQHLSIFKRYRYYITPEISLSTLEKKRSLGAHLHFNGITPQKLEQYYSFLSTCQELTLENITGWEQFNSVQETSSLLSISNNLSTLSYPPFSTIPSIVCKKILLINCPDLEILNLSFPECVELIIERCPKLIYTPSLFPQLKYLQIISPLSPVSDLPPKLSYRDTLQEVTLINLNLEFNDTFLEQLSYVEYLDLTNCRRLTNLAPLTKVDRIRHLFLNYTNVQNVTPLSSLSLETLDLSYCRQLRDVSALGHVKILALTKTYISDVSALARVEQLDLDYCHLIDNFGFLQGVTRLSVIHTGFNDLDLAYLTTTSSRLLILDARWTTLRHVDLTSLNLKIVNLEHCRLLQSYKPSPDPCLSYLPKNFT